MPLQKNPFELDYSIKILPENSSADMAENDTSKLQASKAFRARLQARMREIQLKSKYLKPNKRKLRALQAGTCSESPAEIKKKMRLSFGRGRKVISGKGSPSLTQKLLPDNPKPSPLSELASSSMQFSPLSPLSSGLTPSSELTCPLHSNTPPVLLPNASQSSCPNEGLPSSVDLASKPSSLSSPRSRIPPYPIQSLSGSSLSRKSSEDCIITEVYMPHRKPPQSPESKKNRNIFDLVRPLLKSSIFDRPEHSRTVASPGGALASLASKSSLNSSSAFINSTSKLVSSVASAITKEAFPRGSAASPPTTVPSSSSGDSSLICNSDVVEVVDNNVVLLGDVTLSNEDKEGGEPVVKIVCSPDKERAFSQAARGENHSRKSSRETERDATNGWLPADGGRASQNLEIGQGLADSPKNVCQIDDSSVPGDQSPASTTLDSDLRLPKKNLSSCNLEGRSTFFEKFSKDLEFDLEDIATTNPKAFDTDSNHVARSNESITAEIHESNIKSLIKISNPETLNLHCQDPDDRRPAKRVKPTGQGKKVGFEASCKESQGQTTPLGGLSLTEDGADGLESNFHETDEFLSKTSSSSRSYKISKREMCGLVMDMSKKYLKEFPANGFAFASTLSDEGRHHCSGHQRRSKQKSISP